MFLIFAFGGGNVLPGGLAGDLVVVVYGILLFVAWHLGEWSAFARPGKLKLSWLPR